MGTKQFDNYADLITFTRASGGTALRPISYGSELVTNGTFDTDTSGWTAASFSVGQINFTQSSGEALLESLSAGEGVVQALSLTVGKAYTVSGTLRRTSGSGDGFLAILNNAESSTLAISGGVSSSSNTNVNFTFVATETNSKVYLRVSSSGTEVAFDNISVKEVLFDQPNAPLTLFNHPTNIPRIEYDADGNRLGLLVEEQRTNLLERSEEFDNAYWDKTRLSIDSNVIVAPDGTLTGDKFIDDTSTDGAHFVNRVVNTTNATISIYAKAAEYSKVAMKPISGAFGSTTTVIFDLNAIVADTQSTGFVARIVDVGNGWRRCSVYKSGTLDRFIIANVNNSGDYIIYPGDGTSGIYVWGAQLEAGAFPTSYIPTSGSTATRAADVASIPTSAFGYNASEGTVVCEFESKINNDLNYVWDLSLDSSNRMFSKASINQNLRVIVGGAEQASITSAPDAGQFNKCAYVIKQDDIGLSKNGAAPTIDTSGSIVESPTTLQIGAAINGTSGYLDGHIKSLKYYPRRLSNAQLQELTQ